MAFTKSKLTPGDNIEGRRQSMTQSARRVLLAAMALALSACDGLYFRRIDITGADTAAFAVQGPSTQAVIATLRDYAAQANLRCPGPDELPFECSRQPIRVRAQSSEHGITVCYKALGVAFERGKFERRMDRLQSMLVERFGMHSVLSTPDSCLPR
jgi:hypothetical protein